MLIISQNGTLLPECGCVGDINKADDLYFKSPERQLLNDMAVVTSMYLSRSVPRPGTGNNRLCPLSQKLVP